MMRVATAQWRVTAIRPAGGNEVRVRVFANCWSVIACLVTEEINVEKRILESRVNVFWRSA